MHNDPSCASFGMLPSLYDSEHYSLAQALPLSWSKSLRLPTRRGGTRSYSARYHGSCHPISLLGSSQQQQSLMPSLHSHTHGSRHCIQASIRKNYTHNHFCNIKLNQTWHLTQDIKSRHRYAYNHLLCTSVTLSWLIYLLYKNLHGRVQPLHHGSH